MGDEGAIPRRALMHAVRERGAAKDDAVARALLTVPRHVFLPGIPLEEVYRDDAIVTKRDGDGMPTSSSSQPTIMAIMLDQLGVAPGHRVLEIGAGTGYNAALLAQLVGPDGEVISIDIDEDVVERARAGLAAAGPGYERVTVVCDDGARGHPPRAPYDRIIATVGVWDLSPAWLDQLAPGGRIVVPLDLHGAQVSVAFERGDAGWESRSAVPCGFMRLRGEMAGPGQIVPIQRSPSVLALVVPDDREVDADALRAALAGPPHAIATGVRVRADESGALGTWLAVVEPRSCVLSADGGSALAEALMRSAGFRATPGITEPTGIAMLGRGAEEQPLFEVYAFGYGPDGERLATSLAARVRDWESAGRPGPARLGITAYPLDTPGPLDGIVITKAHTRIVVSVRAT
jgi:protein-L-isoaspartate(D-aspartate) O-methyltransferase